MPGLPKNQAKLTEAKRRREEVEARQRKVEQYLALQMTSPEIQVRIEQEFGCSRRTVRNDINKVYETWEHESAEEKRRPLRRHQLRRTMRTIMQRAMGDRQWNVALACCDRLAKLDGLNEATEILVGGTVNLRNQTSHDKRRELDELMAMYSEKDKANGKGNGSALN